MSSEIKLNLVAGLCIFVAIIFVIVFVLFDKRIGGNVLNTKSYKTEASFFSADKDGNQREVSEEIWNKSYTITIVTFFFIVCYDMFIIFVFKIYIYSNYVKEFTNIDFFF